MKGFKDIRLYTKMFSHTYTVLRRRSSYIALSPFHISFFNSVLFYEIEEQSKITLTKGKKTNKIRK